MSRSTYAVISGAVSGLKLALVVAFFGVSAGTGAGTRVADDSGTTQTTTPPPVSPDGHGWID